MKYSDICPAPKLLVRRASVDAMVEHAGLVDRMIGAGWITVHPEGGGRVELFSVKEIEVAVQRYLNGEWLPTAADRAPAQRDRA